MRVDRALLRASAAFAAGSLIAACGGDGNAGSGGDSRPAAPNGGDSRPAAPKPPRRELPAAPKPPRDGNPALKEALLRACKEQAARSAPEIRERLEGRCRRIK